MVFHINTRLLPMKAHYFLYNAGTAPVWPFMPVLAKQLGFSSSMVGLVYCVLPIFGALVKPLTGAIADRLQIKKAIFLSFIVVTILAFVGIPWIPPLPTESQVKIDCGGDTVVKICRDFFDTSNNCYAPQIISQGRNNETINCQMNCLANKMFLNSVCTSWGQKMFCASPHRPPTNHVMMALVEKAGIEVKESTTMKPPLPVVLAPQEISFTAQILPTHTIREGSCLFLRVGNVRFNTPEWHVPYCNNLSAADCSMKCQNELVNSITSSSKTTNSDAMFMYQFWLLFSLMILGYIGMAVVVSLGDAICFELLGDQPSSYGYQRLWGSVGWGLFSILSGLILDEFSKGSSTKDYRPAIYLMLLLLIPNVIISSRIEFSQSKRSQSIVRDVGKLITEARIFIFLLWCISVGVYQGLSWNFLFWYLEDVASLHGCNTFVWMKTLEGLIMGIQCFLGELPCFFFSGWILKKIGHVNAMTLVLVSHGLRFLMYSSLTNPWWSLPIELFGGLTFGMFYSTMASYASIVAPSGTEATMQGLVGALFEGVGVALGSFLAGQAFNMVSGGMVFLIFGIAAIVCSLLHALAQYFMRKRSSAVILHEGDYNRARYASPNDAIDMMDEEQQDIMIQARP